MVDASCTIVITYIIINTNKVIHGHEQKRIQTFSYDHFTCIMCRVGNRLLLPVLSAG